MLVTGQSDVRDTKPRPPGALTSLLAGVAGVAGAGIAGSVTKNATAGAAIGIGVQSLASAGLQSAERTVHRTEQDRIAAAAGALPVGVVGDWSVTHVVPIEDNEHGQLVVSRTIGDAGFDCREIIFSVDSGKDATLKRAFYTATVCRDGQTWKWASAEPATERWGALQ